MDTRETVLKILKEVKPTKSLEGLTDIVEGGYIDSFELMQLIAMLDEAFQIDISIDEITPENFNSVQAIYDMVERLQ